MPKQPSSLKGDAITPAIGQAAPSSLAFGLNIETVVSVQNHWREYYNPLRALNLERAIALYDFSRRGLNAELQNCYREMEMLYPTLIGLIERRTSPLEEMDWKIVPEPEDKWPDGATQDMVDAQTESLADAYGKIDNIYDAVEWLELGSFRGWSHLEKVYAKPGTSDLTISHLEPVEQWHWTRKSMYAQWEYVPAATQTNSGIPINYEQFIIREVRRPLDRIALILWIRANLCEKDWDGFIEVVGIPKWIVIMPANVPKEKESEYLAAARTIANGGSGALPNGSDAKSPSAEGKGTGDVFRPRLDWLQEQLVLAGTGGLLSMLSMPTGIGEGATGAHDDAFQQIGVKEARRISTVFNQQFDSLFLAGEFPGQPILAKFQLLAKEQVNPVAFVDGVFKLSQAGYQVAAEQIKEKTGYEVTLKPVQASTPSPLGEGGAPAPDEGGATVTNRAAIPGLDTTLLRNSLPSVATAKQRDLGPLFNRLHGIMDLDDPRLMENALRKLQADLNDPKSEIVKCAISNPDLGKALADAMTAALLNGYAQGEAAHPIPAGRGATGPAKIRNRKVLNMADDQPRDSLGKWVDENGGGLSVRDNIKRGNKAIDRSLRQKADVQKAMYRKGLGQVDFTWGTPGDKDREFAGGKGISHALAKHGEDSVRQIPVTLAKGPVRPHPDDENKREVEHQGHKVVLVKEKKDSAWTLTAFHPHNK